MIKHLKRSFMSLYVRIAVGVFIAVSLNIFLTFKLAEKSFEFNFEERIREQLLSATHGLDFAISVFLDNEDLHSIQRTIEDMGAYSFIDTIRVYDFNEKIISSNKRGEIEEYISSEIVEEVIDNNKLISVNSDSKDRNFELAVPVRGKFYNKFTKSNTIGVIFLKANTKYFEEINLKSMHFFIARYFVIGFFLLTIIFFILAYKLYFPLKKVFLGVSEVSTGNYQHEIVHNNKDDFSFLIKKFNEMIKKIHTRDNEIKCARKNLENHNKVLEARVEERTNELKKNQEITIKSLATLAEVRDNETGMHIYRTKNYVEILAEHLKIHPRFSEYLTESNIELIINSAPLHDIGKIAIPDEILRKPGKLTEEEFEEMKRHTVHGRDAIAKTEKIMGSNSFLSFARKIAYSHHEKWDGSGYPQGLKGEEIPVSARLMAIADVYDALISKRHYKDSFTHEEAVKIITEGDGRTMPEHFDPDVLEAFKQLHNEFRRISLEFPEERE